MTDQKRTWLKVYITLTVLIPGLPYALIPLVLLLRIFNLQMSLFVPALVIHNAYFSLPALLFGKGLYPAEEFGYLPSIGGYIVAALIYIIIAFGLSLPISAGIQKLKRK